ncbi:hypothetical protein LS48_00330 [Aequorivita aquimaris]|uniref:Glycosyl transferase family 1 domain-containing protein n=1 Tax=Aequorivita aquimaris TaxID=1548749 RepID=A0A137RLF4_9FLAO|nr:glycosyltransferase family 4 protein [Aequorivita aquimaris]KXO00964.1 hypothetical protein LS48_00330 [Aequorivita aquimaris]
MRLLFVHDHPFFKNKNGIVYTGGSFPKKLWDNYLINFGAIDVYGRNSKSTYSKMSISSADQVSFHLTTKYNSASTLFKNRKTIEKELHTLMINADVVLVRLPSVLGFIASKVAFINNKPLWVEQVGNAKEALSSYGSLMGKIAAPIFEHHNKKIVSKADFVSYVTLSKLQKDYPARNTAITISLSNVIIDRILGVEDLNKNRFSSDIFRLGIIGGFDAKYKGQDIFLKAIATLIPDVKKNLKISLVGKGNYEWIIDLAERLNLKDNIEFIGPLESGSQINEFLKTLSLYIQPSLTEGMPRATIEAMAMGCPVIGSNVGGIPDILSDRFIHKKGNIKELAAHIDYLYSNRDELKREAVLSLTKAVPYLKTNLDKKRLDFYASMNKILKDA